jgi:thiol-activated cytolysin
MRTPALLLATLFVASAPACTTEDELEDTTIGDVAQELNRFIREFPELPLELAVPKTPIECGEECEEEVQEEDLLCSYSRFTETSHYSEFIAFQPNSAALWPGSIVQGGAAQDGFFTPVGVDRAELTFSVSLENISGSPVGYLKNPTLSEFREERNRILGQGVTGATPAAIDFEVTEIHSSSQISLALGASVLWPGGASVTAGFDFHSSAKKTKILVNYTQAYYTIDIDSPIEPADFFAEGVSVEDVSEFMDSDNPPVHVQSITYGRRVVFSVETNETADKIKAALEAAYEASVDVDIKLSAEYEAALSESTIRAFVLGGSGAEAAGAISGFQGLLQYITKGGDYSKDSPGAAIAYKLAYLDNAVTKFAFTTDYAERQCLINRGQLRLELVGLDHIGGGDTGDEIELYGQIAIRVPVADDGVVDCSTGGELIDLWNLNSEQYQVIDEFSSWAPTSAVYIDIDDLPIGADQQLCIFAELWENDDFLNGDDDFGYHERMIAFNTGWAGDHVLQPRGDGENGVDVRLSITLE